MEERSENDIPKGIIGHPEKIQAWQQERNLRIAYDKAFVDTLEELKNESYVEKWEFTKQNSPDDARGVDVWVKINGEDIPVNLKGRKISKENRRRARVLINQGVIILRMVSKVKRIIKPPSLLTTEFKQKVISRENLRTHLYIKRK